MPRSYKAILLSIAAILLLLQVASLGPLRNLWWGTHLYAFTPVPVAILAWLAIAAAILWLWRGENLPPPAWAKARDRRPIAAAVAFAFAGAVLFWVFRSQTLLLGDGLPLKISIAAGDDFHPRQPLTMWVQQRIHQVAGGLFRGGAADAEYVAHRTIALGSVLAGFLFVLTAGAIGRSLARLASLTNWEGWLAAAVLVTQGYMLLFYGYIENYTFYALFAGVYVWLCLRVLEGKAMLLLPGIALVFAVALHLSAAVLIPSFLVLAAFVVKSNDTRRAALRDLAILFVAVLGLNFALAAARDYNLLGSLFDVSGRALGAKEERIPNYIWSLRHLRDFVNEQLLIGPFGLALFLPAAVMAVRSARRSEPATAFMLTLGGAYLAVSWMAGDSNLGYARNWDLLAPGGICFAAAGLFFMTRDARPASATARLLAFAAVISLLHLLPWVWVNHNEALALERLKTLPLGMGRTEVTVANWHLERGEREAAAQWFKKALEVNPNNAPAYAFSAMLLTQQGEHAQALSYYERAVTLRPDKPEYRQNYALTLRELGHTREALPHIQRITEQMPDNRTYWRMLNQALLELGMDAEARAVQQRLLAFAEADLQRDPRDANALVESGVLLVYLDEPERALARFRRLLDIDPNSNAGLLNSASVLVQSGRGGEARPLLERFLQLYPSDPNAPWARQQLANP